MQKTLALLAVMVMPATIWAIDESVTERAVPADPRLQRSLPAVQAQAPEQQIILLQQQVQALQAQIAALQSVLQIAPNGAVTIQSPATVTIRAGTNIAVSAGQNLSVRGSAATTIEGAGTLDLKGGLIKHNGGTKPLATVGSQVQVPGQPIGQITTGSGTVLGN